MKKKILSIFLVVIMLFSVVSLAIEITPGDSSKESDKPLTENSLIRFSDYEELQGDQYVFSQEATDFSNKYVDGNVYACAPNAIVLQNTIIDGNLFVLSNEVTLNGVAVNGSIYALAKNLTITDSYAKDLYLLGDVIDIGGNYDREVKALGERIIIDSEIDGKALISGKDVYIKDNAKLYSDANIFYTGEYEQSEFAAVKNINAVKSIKTEAIKEYTMQDQIKDQIIAWIVEIVKTIIFVGFIMLFTNRNLEKFAEDKVNSIGRFLVTALKGIFLLIVTPILAIAVLIISRGYLIGVSIIALTLYSIALYLSLQIVSVSIGNIVSKKIFGGKKDLDFVLSSIIVMSVIWIFGKLPIVGGLVIFLTITASLGIITSFVFKKRKKSDDVATIEPEKAENKVEIEDKPKEEK